MRFTEEEWIARYNQSLPFALMTSECQSEEEDCVSLDTKTMSQLGKVREIIFDSGATSTAAGENGYRSMDGISPAMR